ncbi:translesion error-prone DNA polymerase V subunit UmuC [Lonsdalea britannica]|uniref:translesion error-prone DNA polymerase V subunit UmuC n=1 Tax=Lonsdalea britannica TaxID=1082704 RepID=UPI0026F1E01B|nr:translesion error-prone DNA polymerase V subunit UmuC [Lonsdalea britannica]
MFALADVNAFYASCETVFRPDLKGKPVVVLSNNDGCVIARNAEAKRLGIPMAMPYFQMRQRLREQQVAVFTSNYALYADLSARVMTTLEALAPRVEIYSIDEAWMDITGIDVTLSFEQFGRQVREAVYATTGLTVGVGMAKTKTLAKLCNHAAKRYPATGGIVALTHPIRLQKLMSLTPVEDVWGVGRRTTRRLHSLGITTALDLARSPTSFIRKHFSVVMERTVRELRGEPCIEFEEETPTKEHIVCSRSFGVRITRLEEMHQAVCRYAERAAEKLRAEKQLCRQVAIFIRSSPHAHNEIFYANSASEQLLSGTQDTRDIVAAAVRGLERIWKDGPRYMKAGVMLNDFSPLHRTQLHLFDDNPPRPNSTALMSVIDKINHEGSSKVWFAGQGISPTWQMKREMLSPAYTTRWSELPVAKIA